MSRNSNRERGNTTKISLSRIEKIAIPVILLLAIWVVYSVMQPNASVPQQTVTSAPSTTQVGAALDFTLPVVGANGLTGKSVTLSSFRGKIVFLEFMEPWCPHCQKMAPVLESLYEQYGSSAVFISVAGPWSGATSDDTAKFIQNYGSGWTYLYDSSGTIMSSYGVTATPTFFVISKNGSVLNSLQGEQTAATLAGAITQASST